MWHYLYPTIRVNVVNGSLYSGSSLRLHKF